VQSHHHQGSHYSCLLKLHLLNKYMQPHHHRFNHTPMYINWLF
jgi:hypothetical protein